MQCFDAFKLMCLSPGVQAEKNRKEKNAREREYIGGDVLFLTLLITKRSVLRIDF